MKRLTVAVVTLSCLFAVPIWDSELVWGNKGQRLQGAACVPGEVAAKYGRSIPPYHEQTEIN